MGLDSASFVCLKILPSVANTVEVLTATLGLACVNPNNLNTYIIQLLCAGAVFGACRLAPVQTKRSVAPLSAEKHNGFSTLFLSAQKVVLVAQGCPSCLQRAPGCPSRALSRCPQSPF